LSLDSCIAFVALGANLDDPVRQIETAISELPQLPETRLLKRSGFYISKPLGYTDQPDYVNSVAMLDTSLSPHRLLACLLDIEQRHGRKRTFRNSPRTLDLDILLYGNQLLDEPGLHIPHPRMHERGFVLLPLAEIAPDTLVPGRGRIADMLTSVDIGTVRLMP
jgi:2-amino-4-hydroxy-6-hydroxymethyldihydropteridine diphosphokinase